MATILSRRIAMTDEDKSKVNEQDKNDRPDVEEVKDV